MKDTLTYILKSITMHPDDVKVEETTDPTGIKHLVITTNPDDVGRVIGKEGKVIKAIRTVMRVAAIIRGERIKVTVVSDETPEDTAPVEENETAEATEETTTPEEVPPQEEDSPQEKSEEDLQVEIE